MAFREWLKRWFSRPKSGPKLVRFYDVENQRVELIQASDLVPGFVEAQVQGIEGLLWVDASKLHQGDIKHPPFADDICEYIHHIENAFKEHRDLTLQEWEDGFRRDENPVYEIALWSHAADIYLEFSGTESSKDRRNDIYRCILACLTTSPNDVWDVLKPSALSYDEAANIVRRFYGK